MAGSAPVPRCVGFRSRWCVLLAGRGQLEVGERAPDFVLSRAGVTARFYAYAGGRPTAVVFDGDGDDLRLGDLADRLAGRDDVALCYVTFQEPAGGAGGPLLSAWVTPRRARLRGGGKGRHRSGPVPSGSGPWWRPSG